jgi:GGDEF domain-containing protein
MREEWAGCEFEFGGDAVSITASFGIAGFCGREAPAFQTLVQRADKALYAAKRAGGNQAMIEDDADE